MYEMSNLSRLKHLDEYAPEAMKAFWEFDKATFEPGAIDALHKQLMAVAVALTTQCPYCIELHRKAARQAGATDLMLAEVTMVSESKLANREKEGGPSYYVLKQSRLGDFLMEVVRRTVRESRLTHSKAAKVLGVSPSSVEPLLRQYEKSPASPARAGAR